jgi:hypothetical protein
MRRAQDKNTILRLRDWNDRKLADSKLQTKKRILTTKQIMKREQRIRNEFFKTALDGFDTRPFLRSWDETSAITCEEVLDLSAKSLAVIDGFELANRAITGPLNMQEAGVEIKYVMEYARKTSKISFFDLVLRRSGLPPVWYDLMMKFFIAKEMGFAASGVLETQLADAIKEAVSLPQEGPFPTQKRQTTNTMVKPKRQPVSERGRERARKYHEKIVQAESVKSDG